MPLHGHCERSEAIPPFQIASLTSFTRNDTLLSASVLVRGSQRLCVNCGQLLTEAVISPIIGPSSGDRNYGSSGFRVGNRVVFSLPWTRRHGWRRVGSRRTVCMGSVLVGAGLALPNQASDPEKGAASSAPTIRYHHDRQPISPHDFLKSRQH